MNRNHWIALVPEEEFNVLRPTEWEEAKYVKCTLNWTCEELEQHCIDYNKLVKSLKEIAYYNDILSVNPKKADTVLPLRLINVWKTWISGIESGYAPEGALEAAYREGGDISLREKEKELIRAHREQWEPEAKKRLGNSPFSYSAIIRAIRLYRLYCLKAPELVIASEKNHLEQAMLLHKICRKVEKA